MKLLSVGMLAITDDLFAAPIGGAYGGRKPLPMTRFRSLVLKREDSVLQLDISQLRDYAAACYLLRDVLAKQPAKVHPWLLHTAAMLQAMAAKSHAHEPLIVTSGFRTQKTNKLVGGAKHSYHMSNANGFFHAMDFHMRHVPVKTLSTYARAIQQGGVGTYKTFVHIDVGPPRTWVDV